MDWDTQGIGVFTWEQARSIVEGSPTSRRYRAGDHGGQLDAVTMWSARVYTTADVFLS